MWPFKKKVKKDIKTKFIIGDRVILFYQNDRKDGIVYKVNINKDNTVSYDINIMGQCPYVLKNIQEEDLKLRP